MFRPKDWKNPNEARNAALAGAYEAGADAMLGKLLEDGVFTYGHHSPEIEDKEVSGYWVFIPNTEVGDV